MEAVGCHTTAGPDPPHPHGAQNASLCSPRPWGKNTSPVAVVEDSGPARSLTSGFDWAVRRCRPARKPCASSSTVATPSCWLPWGCVRLPVCRDILAKRFWLGRPLVSEPHKRRTWIALMANEKTGHTRCAALEMQRASQSTGRQRGHAWVKRRLSGGWRGAAYSNNLPMIAGKALVDSGNATALSGVACPPSGDLLRSARRSGCTASGSAREHDLTATAASAGCPDCQPARAGLR